VGQQQQQQHVRTDLSPSQLASGLDPLLHPHAGVLPKRIKTAPVNDLARDMAARDSATILAAANRATNQLLLSPPEGVRPTTAAREGPPLDALGSTVQPTVTSGDGQGEKSSGRVKVKFGSSNGILAPFGSSIQHEELDQGTKKRRIEEEAEEKVQVAPVSAAPSGGCDKRKGPPAKGGGGGGGGGGANHLPPSGTVTAREAPDAAANVVDAGSSSGEDEQGDEDDDDDDDDDLSLPSIDSGDEDEDDD